MRAGWLVLALVMALVIGSACASRDRSGPRPPLAPPSDDPSASAFVIVGPERARVEVQMLTGATVTTVLGQGLVIPDGRWPSSAVLIRGGVRYAVDLDAVLGGRRGDEPLAAGDQLVVAERYSIRPPSPRVRPSPRVAEPPEPAAATLTCGEILLRIAKLERRGMDHDRPAMAEATRALARCPEDDRAGSFAAACAAARRRLRELVAGGKGSQHPAVLDAEAEVAVCPSL